jgi:hypothetical protein
MGVRQRYDGDEHRIDSAAAVLTPGRIENFNGRSYALQGLQTVQVGQPATFRKNIVVEIDKQSAATAFAANVAVGFIQASQTCVAAGAGDFDLVGRTVVAAGAGVPVVLFRLDA